MLKANRLNSVKEYYFSRKLREVHQLKADGKPIINLGIGSPDLPPPTKVVEAIQQSLTKTHVHGYQSYQGLPGFRIAIAKFTNKTIMLELIRLMKYCR